MATKDVQHLIGTTIPFLTEALTIQKFLGSGSFGQVCLAEDLESGHKYALKFMKPNSSVDELKFNRRVGKHPSIVPFHSLLFHSDFDILVFDYISGGDLQTFLESETALPFTDLEITSIFLQLLDGLDHSHRLGVFHRDLKPENILLSEERDESTGERTFRAFLGDFGLASGVDESASFGCGTRGFMSPECEDRVFGGRPTYSTQKNDVWGLGMVLLTILSGGHLPWDTTVNNPSFSLFKENPRKFLLSHFISLSFSAVDALLEMLKINPEDRADLERIRAMVYEVPRWTTSRVEVQSVWEGAVGVEGVVVKQLSSFGSSLHTDGPPAYLSYAPGQPSYAPARPSSGPSSTRRVGQASSDSSSSSSSRYSESDWDSDFESEVKPRAVGTQSS